MKRLLLLALCLCGLWPAHGAIAQTYTALGASDALGLGASDYVAASASPAKGYVPQIHNYLKARTGQNWTLHNRGVLGYTAPDIVANTLAPAVADAPSVVTLWIGPNDVVHIAGGVSSGNDYPNTNINPLLNYQAKLALFQSSYNTIITQLKTIPNVVIVTANVPKIGDMPAAVNVYNLDTAQRAQVNQICFDLSTIIGTIAAANNVPVIDFYNDPSSANATYLSADGFHPNDAGYAGIFAAFKDKLLFALPDSQSLIVTTTADNSTDDADTTLREAINYANSKAGDDAITFVNGLSGTISLSTALPDIASNVAITSNNKISLSAATPRALSTLNTAIGSNLSVSGLTFSHGQGGITNFGNLMATNCTMHTSEYGLLNFGTATIANCTASGNDYGIWNSTGNTTAINCTLSNNLTGIKNTGTDVNAKNTICAGNGANTDGTVIDGGNNILNGTGTAAGLDPSGLKDNGGLVQTIAIVPGSIAIGGGLDTTQSPYNLTTDGRGAGFPRKLGNGVDIGAYESVFLTPTAPVATDQNVNTDEEVPVNITLSGAGSTLTYIITALPNHGTLSVGGIALTTTGAITGSNLTYTPELNFPIGTTISGNDTFNFKVNNGVEDSNVATVTVTVAAICDPPITNVDFYVTNQNTPLIVTASGVLANDTELDGETLTAFKFSNPAHGTLILNPDGGFTYTPTTGYGGADTFYYTASDGGYSSSPTAVTIIVTPIVPITNFTPTAGTAGTVVNVYGSNFTNATDVQLNGVSAGGKFTVTNASQLTFTVPAGASSGKITVVTPNGSGSSNGSFIVAPTIANFSPANGPVGTVVKVQGENVGSATKVTIGSSTAKVAAYSTDELFIVVPNGAVSGPIRVTNAGGTISSATNFVVNPNVAAFTPAGGAPGTSITLTGNGFGTATDVLLNGVSVGAFTKISGSKITFNVPGGAVSGPITVVTPAPEGNALSLKSLAVAPRISSFTSTGVVGSVITITGENLGEAQTTVKINGTTASVLTRSATQITARVPSTASTGPLTVTNAGGTATSAGNFVVLPKILKFTPSKGAVGAMITITGTTLGGATQVLFNGTSAVPSTVSPTMVTAAVPAGAGSGKITVVTPDGDAVSVADFTVLP